MENLSYPIGQFVYQGKYSAEQRKQLIFQIAETPTLLREALSNLSEAQLDTPYRPEGWTVRQVLHHIPDSHLNAYIRFKLTLTEDTPTIKPYLEEKWANLADTFQTPIDVSLALLEATYFRWVMVLKNMKDSDFDRTYFHPESQKTFTLDEALGLYVWHGKHHIAHITSLRKRMGW
jgi:uncharacterized damage-inducible protein DinB